MDMEPRDIHAKQTFFLPPPPVLFLLFLPLFSLVNVGSLSITIKLF